MSEQDFAFPEVLVSTDWVANNLGRTDDVRLVAPGIPNDDIPLSTRVASLELAGTRMDGADTPNSEPPEISPSDAVSILVQCLSAESHLLVWGQLYLSRLDSDFFDDLCFCKWHRKIPSMR